MFAPSTSNWKSIVAACCSLLPLIHAPAAVVSVNLSGTGASGALNIVGFDNEVVEPSAFPPSRDYVAPPAPSSSHGFAYFQYRYDPANPDAFNDYANEDNPSASFWSIIVSSHNVANPAYYSSVLGRAGAVAFDNLTTSTVVVHPDPGAFQLGDLSYDDALLTGTGTEILAPGSFTLVVSRSEYSFNALNEPTAPGTWTGYPYYYWGADQYTLSVSDFVGTGLTFVDGQLQSMDFVADATISYFGQTWEGTLTFSGSTFTYDIVDSAYISGFGDLSIVMDRTGELNLGSVPEPSVTLLMAVALSFFVLRRKMRRDVCTTLS